MILSAIAISNPPGDVSFIQIILHSQVLFASLVYAATALAVIMVFDRGHTAMDHDLLLWHWDHIGICRCCGPP